MSRPPVNNGINYVYPAETNGYRVVAINGVPVTATPSVDGRCLVDATLNTPGEPMKSDTGSNLESRVAILEKSLEEIISLLREIAE